jgi:hypothetical protein
MSAWPVFDEYEACGGDRELASEIRDAIETELDNQHIASDCPRTFLHRRWGTLCDKAPPDFDKIAVAVADQLREVPLVDDGD